jgi:hypothetical protein
MGQELNKFYAEFNRTTDRYGKSDSSHGEVFYTPGRIILKVAKPILQWIDIRQNETMLFYPDDKKCLRLSSQQGNFVNFINTFLAAVYDDYNLTKQGYTLAETVFKGDTLYSFWNTDKAQIRFTLIHKQNRLLQVIGSDEDHDLSTSVTFTNHLVFAGRYYPARMDFFQKYRDQTSREAVNLFGLIFNQPMPEAIKNFKIPDNVECKTLEW